MYVDQQCSPSDALGIAEEIRKLGDTPAVYRAVCSRAYYAAFQAAKEFHDRSPNPGSVGDAEGGVHKLLIAQLDNPMGPKDSHYWASKGISKSLRVVYQHRLSADYFLKRDVVLNHVEESLRMSSTIIAKVIAAVT